MDVAVGRWLFPSFWVDAGALSTRLILPLPPSHISAPMPAAGPLTGMAFDSCFVPSSGMLEQMTWEVLYVCTQLSDLGQGTLSNRTFCDDRNVPYCSVQRGNHWPQVAMEHLKCA